MSVNARTRRSLWDRKRAPARGDNRLLTADRPIRQSSIRADYPIMTRPLSLRLHPDPILRDICHPVEQFDSWLADVLDEMLTLMQVHDGIGLAGPQVGITQRLFVAGIQGHSVCLVNPVITTRSGLDRMTEGCLSLPGIHVDVQRDWRIEVQGHDAQGRKQSHRVDGLWARVMQHEIDHLNGVLIYDKVHKGI